jgi:predicted small lipoprotein YifL
MISFASRVVLGAAAFIAVAACGQKGPLYLPDKGGEVVTRPGGGTPGTQSPETAPQPSTQPPDSTTQKPEDQKKSQTPR